MSYTLALIDINGDAGQVKCGEWRWVLRQDYGIAGEYHGPARGKLYSLRNRHEGWEIVAHPGLVWDYATGWFDYDAIKEASLGHDILHWLIAIGAIDEKHNDKIDQEFYLMLREFGVPHWRAKWLRRGTNTVDQDYTGIDRKIVYLNKGRRV